MLHLCLHCCPCVYGFFFIMDSIVVFGYFTICGNSGLMIHHIYTSLVFSHLYTMGKDTSFWLWGTPLSNCKAIWSLLLDDTEGKLDHLYVWMNSQLVLIHVLHCRTIFEAIYKMYQQWENVMTNMPMAVLQLLKCCFSYSSPHRNRPTGQWWRCLNLMEILTQQSKSLIAPIMLVRRNDVHSVFLYSCLCTQRCCSSNWYAIN